MRLLFVLFFISYNAQSTSVVNEFKTAQSAASTESQESIQTISSSKRVLILTNKQSELLQGDFVTLVYQKQPLARGIIVRSRDQKVGFKVVRLYDEKNWQLIHTGQELTLIKGDDSYYLNAAPQAQDESLLTSQENLLLNSGSDALFAELGGEKKEAHTKISSNNLLTVALGSISSLGIEGNSASYLHYRFTYSRQILPNIFAEVFYGYSLLKKYPAVDIDTALNIIGAKAGYVFELPFYSFLMPYGGIQQPKASSPGAGTNTATQEQADAELQAIQDVEGLDILYGATFLKRIVPNWTLRLDVDNKAMTAGLTVEF
jgi:hypothetical protein